MCVFSSLSELLHYGAGVNDFLTMVLQVVVMISQRTKRNNFTLSKVASARVLLYMYNYT